MLLLQQLYRTISFQKSGSAANIALFIFVYLAALFYCAACYSPTGSIKEADKIPIQIYLKALFY